MTRAEHLQWCKDRAIEYINNGDIQQGITSMMPYLTEHIETKNHPGIELAIAFMWLRKLNSQTEAEEFINRFH